MIHGMELPPEDPSTISIPQGPEDPFQNNIPPPEPRQTERPILPPGFEPNHEPSEPSPSSSRNNVNYDFVVEPRHIPTQQMANVRNIGPNLPPNIQNRTSSASSFIPPAPNHSVENNYIGPSLPSNFRHIGDINNRVTDPAASTREQPNNYSVDIEMNNRFPRISSRTEAPNIPNGSGKKEESKSIGPDMGVPKASDDSHGNESDDDVIGPSIPSSSSKVDPDYENRLLQYRIEKAVDAATANKREEWMTQLPTKMISFGVGARGFLQSAAPVVDQEERNNVWTSIPTQSSSSAISLKRPAHHLKSKEEIKRVKEIVTNEHNEDSVISEPLNYSSNTSNITIVSPSENNGESVNRAGTEKDKSENASTKPNNGSSTRIP
uniref:Uncharacterized protein n=1 Tax=Rhabditophanes sp. KR3021 TaxID=114890 RepID=A0AC35TRY8_9BILA